MAVGRRPPALVNWLQTGLKPENTFQQVQAKHMS